MSHNVDLFHCLSCGRLIQQEPGTQVPICCETQMVKAAEETIPNNEDASKTNQQSVTTSQVQSNRD